MDEHYNHETENEARCPYCSSFRVEWISGHVLRCTYCGSQWCESCSD
ncbi:MAG: hypothetical protein KGH60_02215 [Candidatus Micrarchaeota archaeon]|nr:hypothetical protein [Candidatus Micrarchaeota archaeon]